MIFSEFWPQKGPLNQEVQELSVFSCLTLFHHIFTFHFLFSDREDVWLRDYHLLRVLASLPCIFHLLLLRPSHHGQMVRFYSHDSPGNVFQVPFTWYPWKGFLVFVHMLSLEILVKFFTWFPWVFCPHDHRIVFFKVHPKHVSGLLLVGNGEQLRQPNHILLDEQKVSESCFEKPLLYSEVSSLSTPIFWNALGSGHTSIRSFVVAMAENLMRKFRKHSQEGRNESAWYPVQLKILKLSSSQSFTLRWKWTCSKFCSAQNP